MENRGHAFPQAVMPTHVDRRSRVCENHQRPRKTTCRLEGILPVRPLHGVRGDNANMVKQLTVIVGKDKGRIFLLPDEGTLQIGRGSNTPTRLSDLRVSRHHCDVQVASEQVVVSDCNSAVGTYVNEQRIIAPQELMPGDVIKIGDTQIKYDDGDVAELQTLAGFAFSEMQAAGLVKEEAGGGAPAAAHAAVTREPLQELVSTSLAAYQIEGVLVRGTSSVLFRARDPVEELAVALKVLLPEMARSDADMQRVALALQPVCKLRHPHLVGLYGVGKTGPQCWFAMELVEGENILQVIQRVGLAGMLDWQHALRVGMHVAQALQVLHEHGIVHNRITPENVLISTNDANTKLAYLTGVKTPAGNAGEILARPGDLFRDIAYWSPERTQDNSRSDIRGDIFSLGSTLYTMISGKAPFQGKTPIETIVQVVQGEPIRPREYQLSMPESFERVLLRMLAKKPAERYQTPSELYADLERVARGPKTAAPPPDNGRASEPAVLQAPPTQGPPPTVPTPPVPPRMAAAAAPKAPPAPVAPPPPPPTAPPPAAAPQQPMPSIASQTSVERTIIVDCPCGQKLQARERYAGTRVRCPTCGTYLLLPSHPGEAAVPQSPAAAPRSGEGGSSRSTSTMSRKKKPAKKDSNPAVMVVLFLVVLAIAAVAGSFWLANHENRSDPPAKKAPRPDPPGTEKS